MKKWFCRCGKEIESEDRPKEEDEIYEMDNGLKAIHTHTYYLVSAPSIFETIERSERDNS